MLSLSSKEKPNRVVCDKIENGPQGDMSGIGEQGTRDDV